MNKWMLIFFCIWQVCSVPAQAAEFKQADGSLTLEFPRDHGSHPDYKTEWWYFVGHLQSADAETFGFELTFFRIGLDPGAAGESAWRHHSIYLTHFALTDDTHRKFYHDERKSRGSFLEAGARENQLEVWNGDWKAALVHHQLILEAGSDEFGIQLELNPAKPPVSHGQNGLSQKGSGEGEASYYVSMTRLEGRGRVRTGKQEFEIKKASAWMDHEITSRELAEEIAGWDWFAVQLDNGEEFMVYQLRRKDGTKDRYSKGSFIAKDGSLTPLSAADFSVDVLNHWRSPETKINYPSGWKISIPKLDYVFEIRPTVLAQELITEQSTGVTYWEGRNQVQALHAGDTVYGNAYAELTGYDKPLRYGSSSAEPKDPALPLN